MRTETVSALNLREPILAKADETLRVAVQRMREKQFGCVFVVDEGDKPIGAFSESLLNRLLVTNPKALDDPLRRHMSDYWCCVKLTDPIIKVLTAMQSRNVRFVCVLDDQGRAVALTGQKGLMEYIADHYPAQVMAQRIGCSPFTQQREGA
jgi:CBS domain-containing protein